MITLKRLAAFATAFLVAMLLAAPGALADDPLPVVHYGHACTDNECNTAYVQYGYMAGPGSTNVKYLVTAEDHWFMRVDGEYEHGGEDGAGTEVWFSGCNLYFDDFRINSWNGERYDWQRIWNTHVYNYRQGCHLRLQSDNNIVIYDPYHRAAWATGTNDYSGYSRWVIQDNGFMLVWEYPWWGGSLRKFCVPTDQC